MSDRPPGVCRLCQNFDQLQGKSNNVSWRLKKNNVRRVVEQYVGAEFNMAPCPTCSDLRGKQSVGQETEETEETTSPAQVSQDNGNAPPTNINEMVNAPAWHEKSLANFSPPQSQSTEGGNQIVRSTNNADCSNSEGKPPIDSATAV